MFSRCSVRSFAGSNFIGIY